eukprot:s10_g11.t1
MTSFSLLLEHVISNYDVDSAKGSHCVGRRTNVLATIQSRQFSDDALWIHFDQICPEGFGLQTFGHDIFMIPGDEAGTNDLRLLWDVQTQLPPIGSKVWLMKVHDDDCDVTQWHYDEHSHWGYALENHDPSVLNHLEFFCGGVGGWSAALRFLAGLTGRNTRSVGIDHDLLVAKTFAMNHGAALVMSSTALPAELFDMFEGNWVICDDICSHLWMKPVTKLGIDLVTISSPCGPWSAASTAAGLDKPEGCLMLHAVLQCRFIRPRYICMENVSGFACHAHKHIIEKALRWIGYRILWQRTIDVQHTMGIVRARWLALAMRIHAPLVGSPNLHWTLPALPLIDHGLFVLAWDEATLHDLRITDEMYQVACNPLMAGRAGKHKTQSEIMASRMYSLKRILPTFMAQYGSQHQLPVHHLRDHAYLGFFLKDDSLPKGGRLFHPAEVALLHGVQDWMFVSSDYAHAWLVHGNSILPIHAMIPLVHVMNSLVGLELRTKDVVESFLQQRLSNQDLMQTHVAGGSIFTPKHIMPSPLFVRSVQELYNMTMNDESPVVWIPQVGLVPFAPIAPADTQIDHSQSDMSVVTLSSTSEQPQPFAVVLKASISAQAFAQEFWFASDLPAAALEAPWFHQFASHYPDLHNLEGVTHLHPRLEEAQVGNPFPHALVQILLDGQLTLMKCEHDTAILSHPEIVALGEVLYDQFGVIHEAQIADAYTVVTNSLVAHGTFDDDVLRLYAALEVMTPNMTWDHDQDALVLTYQGFSTCTKILARFWTCVLPPATLDLMGRRIELIDMPNGLMIQFPPNRTHGVMPPNAFSITLSVLAFRTLLQTLTKASDHLPKRKVLLKWLGRPLIFHDVPHDLTIAMIIRILHYAMLPANGPRRHRIVYNAKQPPPDTLIGSMQEHPNKLAVVMHIVMEFHGGGGSTGAKQQQRLLQQTALASFLLQEGYELQWISRTVETLCNQFGLPRLQNVTSMPPGANKLTALRALLTEASIELPPAVKPQTKKPPMGLPWQQPKRRKDAGKIDPSDYTIVDSFFRNADQTPCLQIPSVRPQATGVCMLLATDAEPWLAAPQKISSDELALLVPGKPPNSQVLGTEVVVPCLNPDSQMVLIHCHMYQLGSKEVTPQKGDPQQISADKCTLVAITLHKEDFQPSQWSDALQRSVPFIREVLDSEGLPDHVLSIWGRSFRQGKTPCSPMQAETMQVHTSVPDDKLTKLLTKSGFNKLYCTPKDSNGRLDTTFQVLWLQCDATQAAVYSAQVTNALGLVRGRKSLGLRFREADFEPAWHILCPSMPLPARQQGDKVYRVDGLPFGVTKNMAEQWAAKIGWKCQPVRELGPQAMLIRSDDPPPSGIPMFNAQPVLIRLLPPRVNQSGPLLVGPKASKPKEHNRDSAQGTPDPWAKWQGPRLQASPSAAVRTPDGPTETRLASQDKKLEGLEQQLKDVIQSQEKLATQTEKRFMAAELREKQHHQQVSQAMDRVKQDLAQTLDTAFQKNAHMMEERHAELKHLLLANNKRSAPPDGSMQD